MNDGAPVGGTGFVAYEYRTVRVDPAIETLCKESYRDFGWTVEENGPSLPGSTDVAVRLRRDRHVRNRPMVDVLQDRCDLVLDEIGRLEHSKSAVAAGAARVAAVVGGAATVVSALFLAAGLLAVSLVLLILGATVGASGYLLRPRFAQWRATAVGPTIDHDVVLVRQIGEQVRRLHTHDPIHQDD